MHHLSFQAAKFIWNETGRVAAPNGGLMRTSVLGCFQFEDLKKVKENTLQICKVTHADPRFDNFTLIKKAAAFIISEILLINYFFPYFILPLFFFLLLLCPKILYS